jgi:hypothetical protein
LGDFSKRLDDFPKPLGDFIKSSVQYDFLYNFQLNLGGIAHNVPAVYDVLAARIRALRSKDQGRQNVGGVRRGHEP